MQGVSDTLRSFLALSLSSKLLWLDWFSENHSNRRKAREKGVFTEADLARYLKK